MKFVLTVSISPTGQVIPLVDRMPKLRPKASVTIEFEKVDLINLEEASYWSEELIINVPTENGILLGFNHVTVHPIPVATQKPKFREIPTGAFQNYVMVKPKESLVLVGSRGGSFRLKPCPTSVETFENSAQSLNHAYTRLSEILEPTRRSHTANIFKCAYYFNGLEWHLIDSLRSVS